MATSLAPPHTEWPQEGSKPPARARRALARRPPRGRRSPTRAAIWPSLAPATGGQYNTVLGGDCPSGSSSPPYLIFHRTDARQQRTSRAGPILGSDPRWSTPERYRDVHRAAGRSHSNAQGLARHWKAPTVQDGGSGAVAGCGGGPVRQAGRVVDPPEQTTRLGRTCVSLVTEAEQPAVGAAISEVNLQFVRVRIESALALHHNRVQEV